MLSMQANLEMISWLTLHFAPRFGRYKWQQCLARFDSLQDFCRQKACDLGALGLDPETVAAIKQPNQQKINQVLCWLQEPRHAVLTLRDACYPPRLAQIADPPPLLYVDGDVACLSRPQIAIVGSRRASHVGSRLAGYFAEQLAAAGWVITSGLAAGIDAAGHWAAVQPGTHSVAVLGSGLDRIYPAKNRELADKIRENGAIISEYAPSTPPRPHHFPCRNRVISGLSLGVLVVEAAMKSGSLITAQLAAEQGREVFAIPGSILNSFHQGCHYLIQQGAKLVTNVDDILRELSPQLASHRVMLQPEAPVVPVCKNIAALDQEHKKLLECIGFEMTNFEQLVDHTGFSTKKVATMLCNLRLNGYIREEFGGYTRKLS